MRYIVCPTCGHPHPDPDHMEALELRLCRGLVGRRLGYEGPMPVAKFAAMLTISARTLSYYEAGTRLRADGRVVPIDIPPLVAQRARELREQALDDPTQLALPKRWEEQRIRDLRKRELWRARKAARDAGERPRGSDDPPPF